MDLSEPNAAAIAECCLDSSRFDESPMIKNTFSLAAAALLALACATHQSAPVITGWVSDASCGAAHVGGKNPSCVVKCAKGGAHVGHPEWTPQPLVIVEDGSGKLLVIDNPESVTGLEAQHVKIHGRVHDGDRLAIDRVERITS
jgi:hypothetical protein